MSAAIYCASICHIDDNEDSSLHDSIYSTDREALCLWLLERCGKVRPLPEWTGSTLNGLSLDCGDYGYEANIWPVATLGVTPPIQLSLGQLLRAKL